MRIILTLTLLISTLLSWSSDFYWVGNDGQWSDFQNHWATSSGGTEFHDTVPSKFDNVFFDQNSVDKTAAIVLDENANTVCANLDASQLQFELAINTPLSFGSFITVHGDLKLNPFFAANSSPQLYIDIIYSDSISIDIETNNDIIGIFLGAEKSALGIVNLQSDLRSDEMNFHIAEKVNFRSNGYNINVQSFSAGDSCHLDVSNSRITTSSIELSNSVQLTDFQSEFESITCNTNGVPLSKLTVNPSFFSEINSNSSFDTLIVNSKWLAFSDSIVINIGHLVVNSSSTDTVALNDGFRGIANNITINFTKNSFCGDYLIIQNIKTIGATAYAGDNSQDNGGNSGWIFNNCITAIDEDQFSDPIQVYPTNVEDEIHIISKANIREVKIYSSDGALIDQIDTSQSINMSAYKAGIYLLYIVTNKEVSIQRVRKI